VIAGIQGSITIRVCRHPLACKLLILKTRRDVRVVEGARLENPFGEALQATRNHRNAHAINGFIPEQYFSLLTRKSQ
jgi:hypothetical protein